MSDGFGPSLEAEQQQRPPLEGYRYPAYGPPHPAPDWAALADRNHAAIRRRKRLLRIGAGVLGTITAAALASIALGAFSSGGGASPGVPAAAPPPAAPSASSRPPAGPLDVIGTAARDTAPLTSATLFPDVHPVVDGRSYGRTGGALVARDCAEAAAGGLGEILTRNGCAAVYRATYSAKGIAVSLGIAVFDEARQAAAAKTAATGNILPLNRRPRRFCRRVVCRSTSNAVGRYAVFTIGGFTDGRPVPGSDRKVRQATLDIDALARDTLLRRGRPAPPARP